MTCLAFFHDFLAGQGRVGVCCWLPFSIRLAPVRQQTLGLIVQCNEAHVSPSVILALSPHCSVTGHVPCCHPSIILPSFPFSIPVPPFPPPHVPFLPSPIPHFPTSPFRLVPLGPPTSYSAPSSPPPPSYFPLLSPSPSPLLSPLSFPLPPPSSTYWSSLSLLPSGLSGLVAATVSTPADVVKTRIMNNPGAYQGSMDCLMRSVCSLSLCLRGLSSNQGFPGFLRVQIWIPDF